MAAKALSGSSSSWWRWSFPSCGPSFPVVLPFLWPSVPCVTWLCLLLLPRALTPFTAAQGCWLCTSLCLSCFSFFRFPLLPISPTSSQAPSQRGHRTENLRDLPHYPLSPYLLFYSVTAPPGVTLCVRVLYAPGGAGFGLLDCLQHAHASVLAGRVSLHRIFSTLVTLGLRI